MKIIEALKKIKNEGINNLRTICVFVHFIYYRKKYKISFDDYISHGLYKKNEERELYLLTNPIYRRRYKRAELIYVPNQSRFQKLFRRIDYAISSLVYPGLDATDYYKYQFYNFRHGIRKTFITEGGLQRLDKALNSKGDKTILDDKSTFNSVFSKYINRKWMYSKDVSYEDFACFCDGLDKVIIKPLHGVQGAGIAIYSILDEDSIHNIYKLIAGKEYLAEEVVVQHKSLSKLNPSSVNTIRVYSVLSKGEVVITGAVLRIGRGDKPTDNYSDGGMAATIDLESGIVISGAINKNNECFYIHPVTNEPIIGFKIPCWEDAINSVKSAHQMIPELRYVGWDCAINNRNEVVFLEGNTCAGVSLQQHPMLSGKKQLYDSLI